MSELVEIYKESCDKHNTTPIESIVKHLGTVDLGKPSRMPILNLREQTLTAESCEALEEVLKRVRDFRYSFVPIQISYALFLPGGVWKFI